MWERESVLALSFFVCWTGVSANAKLLLVTIEKQSKRK